MPSTPLSRRRLIQQAGAMGSVAIAGGLLSPRAQAATALETQAAKIGFIALTDAAPLFVADEKGYFKKHGMGEVEVLKQSSWGSTRDNLVLGSGKGGIDGAHILTPMPYLISTGAVTANKVPVPMNILARLNLGGQCISVADEYQDLKVGLDTRAFGKALLAKRLKTGKPVNAAMTFPGGTHDLWLRYWMAAGGVDPNKDITTIVVPPAQMVANMKVGSMDSLCVCEPWNRQLINQKIGYTALTTSELWMNHPEKAFAMRADWVQAHPNAAKALLKAVMEAQMWCEDPAHRAEVAQICSRRRWINAPEADVIDRVKGDFDYGSGRIEANSRFQMRFWKDHASYPFQSHDLWFLTENMRWGYLPPSLDTQALIARVNREDLWRAAARELGVAAKDIPSSPSRGVETFFDGKVFDPANPKKYLDSLSIKTLKSA